MIAGNIIDIFISSLKESVGIIVIVFLLMLLIEIVVLKYKHILIRLSEKNSLLAYIVSSVFGIIPNCSTTFAMDTLYMSGLLSFGGLIAVMVSTVDDIGLLVFSKTIEGHLSLIIMLIYFLSLLVLGIAGGKIADFVAVKLKWKFNIKCDIVEHEAVEFKLSHFIREHIYEHIIRKHIWKIFIWMFITLFVIGLFPDIFSQGRLMTINKVYVLLFSALIGLIPSPAPNFLIFNIFVMHPASMFSVFLTNSIVQDGHGLLPILGYSLKDAVKVKVFKLIFGIIVGLIVLSIGY